MEASLCSDYLTTVIKRLDSIPNEAHFIEFLETNGWEITEKGWYDSAEGTGIARATKIYKIGRDNPKVSLRLTQLNATSGYFSFTITEGKDASNKLVYEKIMATFNKEFDLGLKPSDYMYYRNCD